MADFDILSIADTPENSEKLKALLSRTDLPEARDPEKISENDMIDYDQFMSDAENNGWNTGNPEVKELLDAAYDIAAESTNYMAASFPNEPHETTEQQTAALEALLLDAAGSISPERISSYSLNVVQRAIEEGHLQMEQESLAGELDSLDRELESLGPEPEEAQIEEENRQLAEEERNLEEEAPAQQEAAAEEVRVPKEFDGYVRYDDFFDTSVVSVREALQNAGIPFANDAAHGLSFEPAVKTAFTLYLLAEEGMGTEDLKKLDALSSEDKREIGQRFIGACREHPVMPGAAASAEESRQNAAWFGGMAANAIGTIKKEGVSFPSAAEIGDPEKDAQLRQSSFELLGYIGRDFGDLTATWFDAAGEDAFAQGYGGMTALQGDRNILSAAHVVSRAAGMSGRSLNGEKAGLLKNQVKEELLPGVEGQPVEQLNSQANRIKGILAEEELQMMMSGAILREPAKTGQAALFQKLRPAADDLRLEPYIVMPDLASMSPEALDKAAADFDAIFRPLQEKEQPVFDLGGGSVTKGLLISDATVEDAYRVYNLTSAVREALGDRQVSDEDLAKYEKAYALHMLADPDEKINVAYHPHYLSQAGTAQDPVWTAESTAQDPRYDIGAVRKNELDQLEGSIAQMKTARTQEYRAREELQARVNESADMNARLNYERAEDHNRIRERFGYEKLPLVDIEAGIQERASKLALMKEQHQAKIVEEEASMRLAYETREQQRREVFRTRRENAREQAAKTREARMLRRQQEEEERQRLERREQRRRAEREERIRAHRQARIAESIRREQEAARRAEEARIRQQEERRRRQSERRRRVEEIRRRRAEIAALRERNRNRREEIAAQKEQRRTAHAEAVRVQQLKAEENRRLAQERELRLAKERELRAQKEKVARAGYPTKDAFMKAAYENGWDAHGDARVLKTLYLIYANNKGNNKTEAQQGISQEAKTLMADIGLNRMNSLEERGAAIGRMKDMVFRYKYEDLGPAENGSRIISSADERIAAWNAEHPTKALQAVLDDLRPQEMAKDAEIREKQRREEEERQRREAAERERREAQERKQREEQERIERERLERERARQEAERARQAEADRARREAEERALKRREALHAQYALKWGKHQEFLDAAKKTGWAPDGEKLPVEDRRALKSLFLLHDMLSNQVERDLASEAEKKLCEDLKPVLTQMGSKQNSSLARIRLMARAGEILEKTTADENPQLKNQVTNARTNIGKWQKAYPDPLTKDNITVERFKEAAYENGWAQGRDDAALESLFDRWKKQEKGSQAEAEAWSTVNNIAQDRLDEQKPVTDRNRRLRDAAARFEGDSNGRETLIRAAETMEAGEERENLTVRRRITLKNIRGKGFLQEYDAFLPMVYASMFRKDGEYNEQIRHLVRGAEQGTFFEKGRCEDFLKGVKGAIDSIPEGDRTDAHKELAGRFDEMLEQAGRRTDEREKYIGSVRENWNREAQPGDTLMNALYRAAEGMPEDHPYRKVLEGFRTGKSGDYPQLDGTMGDSKAFVVMNDLLHKADDLLKKEPVSRKNNDAIEAAEKTINSILRRVVLGSTGPEDVRAIGKAAQDEKMRIGGRDPEASAILDEAAAFSDLKTDLLFGLYDGKTHDAIVHLKESVTKYLDKAQVRDRRSDALLGILGHLDTKQKAEYEHRLQSLPEEKEWWKDKRAFKADAKANGWTSQQDQEFLDRLHNLNETLKRGAAKDGDLTPERQKQLDAEKELQEKTGALISEIAENKAPSPQERRRFVERFENLCEPYMGRDTMGLLVRADANWALNGADQWHSVFPSNPTSENLTVRNLTRALKKNGWDEKRDGALIDAMVKANYAAEGADRKAVFREISKALTHTLSKDKPLTDRDAIAAKIRDALPKKPAAEAAFRGLDKCIEETKSLKELEDPGKYRKQFKSDVEKKGFLSEYMPLLLKAYDTGFTRDGKYDEKIRGELQTAREEDHSSRQRCEERLNAIKNRIDLIPGHSRTQAQQQFADGFGAQMKEVGQKLDRAEKDERIRKQAREAEKNWRGITFFTQLDEKLIRASEGMEPDHPFHKALENFQKGTCGRVPELNGKSQDGKNIIVFQELLKDVIGILEKEPKSPEVDAALEQAKERREATRKSCLLARNPGDVIREIGFMGECALGRTGENAGELTGILQRAEGFSRLDLETAFGGYRKQATNDALDSLDRDLCRYLDNAYPMEARAAEALLILEKLNPAQSTLYREKFAGLEAEKQELTNKNNNIRTYRNELQEAADHVQDHGFEAADPSYRLLPEKSNFVLSTSDKLNELAQLFDTRKTGMFSGDTRYYTNAKTALDTYINNRNQIAQQISALAANVANGTISVQQFREQAGQHMEQLQQHENRLKEQMRKYAIHATDGSIRRDTLGSKTIDKMTKSAGAARLTASMGILEYLNNAASLVPGAQVQEMTRTNRNHQRERAKEISFQDLYRQNMQNDEVRGIENAEERRKEAVRRTRRTLRDNNWRGPNQNQH